MIEAKPQSQGLNHNEMRKVQFENSCLYHIYNRGTEKREVFLDKADYLRFIRYFYELNNINTAFNIARKIDRGFDRGFASINSADKEDGLLVDIIAFCLMPNHFHLILRQLKDDGIAKFMQKLGTGYSMYFNKKIQRNGVLFQGSFKAILIENDEYLIHLSRYVHINPVESIEPHWKNDGVKNWSKVDEFLQTYRWSSYLDYVGIKNFPSLINKETIDSCFRNERSYKNFVNQWLVKDLGLIKEVILE